MKTPDTEPTLYHPAAAIVVFKPEGQDNDLYLEHYDMDENGCPVNPRPLSVKEAQGLSKALDTRKEAAKAFLKPKGLLPSHVLHINPSENGSVVWYTKPQSLKLHFTESLGIASQETAPARPCMGCRQNKAVRLCAERQKQAPPEHAPV
jgi:hypothetical protein